MAKKKAEPADVEPDAPTKTQAADPSPSTHPVTGLVVASFDTASTWCECDKMRLTKHEETLVSDSITVLVGPVNSKLVAAVVVTLVILMKVFTCWTAIRNKVKR